MMWINIVSHYRITSYSEREREIFGVISVKISFCWKIFRNQPSAHFSLSKENRKFGSFSRNVTLVGNWVLPIPTINANLGQEVR